MKSVTIVAAGLGLLLAVGTTTSAFAWQKNFAGTRDQVRAACAASGGDLAEGNGRTGCVNWNSGNHVNCNDAGQCIGGGPGPMPRRASYGQFVDLAIGTLAVKAAPAGAPASLTGPSTESAPAEPSTLGGTGAPSAGGGVIIGHIFSSGGQIN